MRSGDLNMTDPEGRSRVHDRNTPESLKVGRSANTVPSDGLGASSASSVTQPAVDRFFFVHLQKTGGTTLIHRLPRCFRLNEIYPDSSDGAIERAVISVDLLRDRWRTRGDEIRIVTGHFPLCTAEVLATDFTTLTVLREPVERTLSYLRHHRETTPSDRSKSLEQIYEDPLRFHGLIHNHMVKMLSLTVAEMVDGALTRMDLKSPALERAKNNLERVDVVGLQEHFEEFWEELSHRFGWQLGDPARSNQTEHVPISRAFRERIARDNELDADLYEHARRLCARRTKEATTSISHLGIGG
jgi:hypothetical protein